MEKSGFRKYKESRTSQLLNTKVADKTTGRGKESVILKVTVNILKTYAKFAGGNANMVNKPRRVLTTPGSRKLVLTQRSRRTAATTETSI
jgi:hypothetical protein